MNISLHTVSRHLLSSVPGSNLKFYAVGLKLHHAGGGGDKSCMNHIHISSSLVKIRLHTENQLHRLPGTALKVSVVV